LVILVNLVVVPAKAAPAWLIATSDTTARAGALITVEVIKPKGAVVWPATLNLIIRVMRDEKKEEVELTAFGSIATEDIRRSYRGVLPTKLSGLVRIELVEIESNRLALVISTSDTIDQMKTSEDNFAKPVPKPIKTGSLLFTPNEPALSVNEPMYFIIGNNSGAVARFQLSFKYQLFDPDSLPVTWFPPLSGMYFGYTQASLWDLGDKSKPFYDTSYRPSFFWQGMIRGENLLPDLWRAGYEHESNGKDGTDSRSINTLFIQPIWHTEFSNGRSLIFAPKLYGYLSKSDNPDIPRYRGYADWILRYGREEGRIFMLQVRSGTAGYGSAQFDFSYPLRRPLFTRAGGFIYLQVFTGYGQSLLDYNRDDGTQVMLGFSMVR